MKNNYHIHTRKWFLNRIDKIIKATYKDGSEKIFVLETPDQCEAFYEYQFKPLKIKYDEV